MKKIIYILVALFATTTTFAAGNGKTEVTTTTEKSSFHKAVSTLHDDVKEVTSTLYGDGKDAITTLYPDVKSAVVAIGKAIGVAAEHVYTVLVKKFVVDGIVQLIPFLAGLILLIIGCVKLNIYLKANPKIEWHVLFPLIFLAVGGLFIYNVDYNVMVMGLVNPEYGALNYILEYSKQMLLK